MSLETEVASLTTATTNLLNAVMTSKGTLDQAVTDAETQVGLAATQVGIAAGHAATATTKAGEASASAGSALSIFGSAQALNDALATAQSQASLAAGYAASAGSVAQQDLSAFSGALHSSTGAITAMFIYDTSRDSDGGAWTEKCQHTSWYNETLSGKWLGIVANETAARAVSGATTGDYYQTSTNGRCFSLNAGSGATEVWRGNKRSFPKVAAIVCEASSCNIYDLTEPGRPMWMRLPQIATTTLTLAWFRVNWNVAAVGMMNGLLVLGTNSPYSGLSICDFASDQVYTTTAGPKRVSERRSTADLPGMSRYSGSLANSAVNALSMAVLPDAPINELGLRVPSIAVATTGVVALLKHNATIINSSSTLGFTGVTLTESLLSAARASQIWYTADNPNGLGASFTLTQKAGSTATDWNSGNTGLLRRVDRSTLVRSSGALLNILRNNQGVPGNGIAAKITDTYNSGWLAGDIRRVYLANSQTADRSYKAATATVTGTITETAVNTGNQLIGYSGFSPSNYIREDYSADLDFGTGEWSISAWVSIPTNNAAIGRIVSRAHSSGPSITLSVTATNQISASAFDGTTTRTATTTATYGIASWIKVRATYTTDGKVAVLVNGVEVASATGAPLLTLNNSSAVLTIGNSFALDAAFSGSICLVKLSGSVPTSRQAQYMYVQEGALFSTGAQCLLPASTDILDASYDGESAVWSVVQATHESSWSGLVRTGSQTPSAGSFAKCAAGSGNKLLSRTTTSPGVDLQMPSRNLRAELRRRREVLLANQDIRVFDFDAVTSQTDFALPAGYEARAVYVVGVAKREGAAKDYIRLHDGFAETVRFAVAPGNGVWVQVQAVRGTE